jgi:hypothetical protein
MPRWDQAPVYQPESSQTQAGPRPITIGTPDPKIPLQIQSLQQQLEIERAANRRAEEAAARARETEARGNKTTEARGGVETTGEERKAAFLATRVAGGLMQLGKIPDQGAPTLTEGTVGGTKLGNYAISENRQRIMNAQLDMLDAALTLGTGAAYNKEQLEGYRQSYFPQPGDEPGTIEDKKQRLKVLLEASRLQAGAASGQIDEALTKSGIFALNVDVTDDGGVTDPRADADIAAKAAEEAKAAAPVPKPPTPYSDTPVSQGLSGVNEGIAGTLGMPVDLANTALSFGAKGLNYLAGTDFQTAPDPLLGGQWWKDRLSDTGSIGAESKKPGMAFLRRVGQSVGSAALPVAGTAGSIGKGLAALGSAAGGGVGAATAQNLFPGNPYAEMGGELLGGGLTTAGMFGRARSKAVKAIENAVPTVPQLKQQAGDLYSQAESRGIVAGPNVTGNLAGRVKSIADNEKLVWPNGKIDPSYPRAGAAMQMMDAHAGQSIDPRQIQVLRDNLTDAVGATEGKEQRIAQQMLKAFDEETIPLAPELGQARGIASRYINAQKIGKARDLADASASTFSGSGPENAIRTQFRNLDKKITSGAENGFNPATVDAIRQVTRGTPLSNAARQVGKLAPTGVVSFGLGTGVPAAIGNMVAGPAGAATMGVAAPALGMFGRKAAEKMAMRSANLADLVARNGGALPTPQVLTPDLERLYAAGLLGQSGQYLGR